MDSSRNEKPDWPATKEIIVKIRSPLIIGAIPFNPFLTSENKEYAKQLYQRSLNNWIKSAECYLCGQNRELFNFFKCKERGEFVCVYCYNSDQEKCAQCEER